MRPKYLSRCYALGVVVLLGASVVHGQAQPAGDRLVVGAPAPDIATILASIPLPTTLNQKFCDLIELVPNELYEAYVPTAAERSGNFSAFAGFLLDTDGKTPIPGGIIPDSRLGSIFAWRIASPPGGVGPDCATGRRFRAFSSRYSISDPIPSERRLVLNPSSLAFNFYPSPFFPFTQIINLGSRGTSIGFTATSSISSPAGGKWLTINSFRGSTPAQLGVTVDPSGLAPGLYAGSVTVTPDVGDPQIVPVSFQVSSLAPQYDVPPTLSLQYDPLNPQPVSGSIALRSPAAAAVAYSAIVEGITPRSRRWLTLSKVSGSLPDQIIATVDPTGLGPGTYLALVRYTFTQPCTSAPGFTDGADSQATTAVTVTVTSPNPPVGVDLTPPPVNVRLTAQGPSEARASLGPGAGDPSFTIRPALGATGPAAALNFTITRSISSPAGANWLTATATPLTATGNPLQTTSTVTIHGNPAGLDASVTPYLGHVAIDGVANNVTFGALITVELSVPVAVPKSSDTRAISASLFDPCAPVRQFLAQIADGSGWKTTITLVNTDPTNAQTFTLRFHPGSTDAGSQLVIAGERLADLAIANRSIPAGGSLILETQGSPTGPLWQGWAEVTSAGAIGGVAIFRKTVNQTYDAEGAVPLKSSNNGRFLLPFDNTGAFLTAMAIANPSATQSLSLAVTFRDESGQAVRAPSSMTLAPGGHEAFTLVQRFSGLEGRRGVAEFSAPGQDIAALGLRFQTQLNAFSSFESIDPGPAGRTQFVSHIADGTGWKTSIVLVNTDTANGAVVDIRFWPGQDTPATFPIQIVGRPVTNFLLSGVAIAPGGSVVLETPGGAGGALWQGWAELTALSGTIGGLAVFRKLVPGDQYSEGSVRIISSTAVRMVLPFDDTNQFVTSMALANSDDTQADTVGVVLRTEFGQTLLRRPGETGSLSLKVKGHSAFSLPAQFDSAANLRGVIDLTSTNGRLIGLGFRFNPRFAFTSLPVLRR